MSEDPDKKYSSSSTLTVWSNTNMSQMMQIYSSLKAGHIFKI